MTGASAHHGRARCCPASSPTGRRGQETDAKTDGRSERAQMGTADDDRRSRILRSFLWLFGRSYIRLGVSWPGRTPSLACGIIVWTRLAGTRQDRSTVSTGPSGLIDNEKRKVVIERAAWWGRVVYI